MSGVLGCLESFMVLVVSLLGVIFFQMLLSWISSMFVWRWHCLLLFICLNLVRTGECGGTFIFSAPNFSGGLIAVAVFGVTL